MSRYASRIIFYLIMGGAIDTLLIMAGGSVGFWLIAPIVAVGVITTAGELLFLTFGLKRLIAWLPASFVAGVSVVSCTMLAPSWALGWSAQNAFLLCAALILIAALVLSKKVAQPQPVRPLDAIVILPCVVLAVYFCRHIAQSLPTIMLDNTLPAWFDYFAHGTITASFGGTFLSSVGDIMLPGVDRVFYHYGSFMLPAALSEISGLSGLALATSILLPLGLLVGLCGLFALAAELAGLGAALIAVWLLACLPDASHYFLKNGFLGFHWLTFVSPGTGYAIGTAAIAYLCALPWFKNRFAGPLVLAALLTLMLILIRAHMFLLMAPALTAAVMLAALPPPWRARVFFSGLLLATALTVLVVSGLLGRDILQISRPAEYVKMAFQSGPAFFRRAFGNFEEPWSVLAGGFLLLPGVLGFWTLLLPAVVFIEAKSRRFQPLDYIPGLMCGAYLLLIFWAPAAGNNDISEYKHRHFPLLCSIVIIWVSVRSLQIAGVTQWLASCSVQWKAVAVAIWSTTTIILLGHTLPEKPKQSMAWAVAVFNVRLGNGVPQAADFLRTRSKPGDIMMIGGEGAQGNLTGTALELVSMTNIPSYVGRVSLIVATRPPAVAAIAKARAADIAATDRAPDSASAMAILRDRRVRWYVMTAPDLPAWDMTGALADFHAGSIYVYDAGSHSVGASANWLR